ncbi:MAG: hypothetical protein ACT4OV_08280 [Microthrixaceae bacterium]
MSPLDDYARIESAMQQRPSVTVGRMLRSNGLKVNNKVFAFLQDDALVVKLPASEAQELVASGSATPYEPSPGRRMKEWVAVPHATGGRQWPTLVEAALSYVATRSKRAR